MSAFDKQVGGSHYKEYVIQPYEFFFVNQIPHHKAAIIRRILRYDHSTGKGVEDLEKIAHEVELIRELEAKKGKSVGNIGDNRGTTECLPTQEEIAIKWREADQGLREGRR